MKKINLFLLLLLPLTLVRAAVIYVSPSGSGTNGNSWSTAYNTLNSALSASVSGDEIWVAQGTYTIVGSSSKLNFKAGVNVYGGFAGTEVSRAERNTNSSLTVISHETVLASNFKLLNSSDLSTVTIWDGFTFDGKNVGQGVLLSGNCELDNCVVKNCMVTNSSGAGVYMSATNSTLPVVLKNVELSNNRIKVSSSNTSPLGGAGVYVKNGTTLADINNCTIKNNTLEGISSTGTLEAMGAGIYIVEGTVRNCTLDQNVVMNSALSTYSHNNFTGGAIAIVPQNTSVPAKQVVVDKCVITNSSSNATGGAIIINPRWSGQYHGNYTFSNCIITNNKSNAVGGGIMATATPVQTGTGWTLNISNSVISNNSAASAGGGIYINIGCILNITNTSLVNNIAGSTGGGGIFMQGVTHTIKPTFKNVLFWGNECAGKTADIVQMLTSSQPSIISNCAVQSYTPSSTQFANATLTNNINLNANNTAVDGPNLILPATTAGYGASDALTANWKLAASSPCINSGINVLLNDIEGTTRPQSGTSDIGAYEFVNTIWTGNVSSDWSVGGNWSAGLPLTATDIKISSTSNLPIVNSTATVGNLSLDAGAKLTIGENANLTVSGDLTLDADAANGSSTLINSGTLNVQGTSHVKQYLSAGRNWYISSPVTNSNVSAITSASSVVKYDEPSGAFVTETSSLNPTTGYVSVIGTNGVVTFDGVLNNGDQTAQLTRTYGASKAGFQLVGNPYPSYLNWDDVEKNNVGNTLWFRSRNVGNTAYVFDTYNAAGRVGTDLNGEQVNSHIPPMQAFWVRVNAPVLAHDTTGTLTFRNTMRSHKGFQTTDAGNVTDIRLKSKALTTDLQKVLRLEVSNGTNADQAIVLFNKNAGNQLDEYDSQKISNNNPLVPEICTSVGSENLAINGLSNPEEVTELPLTFRTGESAGFSIKATEIANFSTDMRIVLKDNLLHNEIDLTMNNTYNFNSTVGTTSDRFSILFKSVGVTTQIHNQAERNEYLIFVAENAQIGIMATSDDAQSASIELFNVAGQKVKQSVHHTGTMYLSTPEKGVYFVSVKQNEKKFVQKVIVK